MELSHETGIDIAFGRIAALRAGNQGAPKVLALHGWLDNAASFVPLARHLGDLDLVAVDLPGHGRSTHLAIGSDYSFYGSANVVLDIADALGWERFALLGHSMGAGIGSLVAAASPQRVARLVAIEALGALAEAPERTAIRMREAAVRICLSSPFWMRPGRSSQPVNSAPAPECSSRARCARAAAA